MRGRLLVTGLVALVGLTATLTAMGAGESARLTEAAGSGFPSRSYILSLPHGMKLKPGAVQAFENGTAVSDLIVTPVSESTSRQFGVVLAIDSSTSMEGKPEEAALAAARDSGSGAGGDRLAARVPVSSAVPVRVGEVRCAGAAAARHRDGTHRALLARDGA